MKTSAHCHTPVSGRAEMDSVLSGSRAGSLPFIWCPLEHITAVVMLRQDNGWESAWKTPQRTKHVRDYEDSLRALAGAL